MLIAMIAGALGSGKTTSLLSLAQKFNENGYRVGILENDAGKIPVDAPVLRERGYSVTDMPTGCICCNLSSKLPQSLDNIRNEFHPDILFIEPSGLAAPGILKDIFQGQLHRDDRMICLYMMDLLRFSHNRKLMTSPFFERSLKTADLILYSKAKKTEPETINAFSEYSRTISVEVEIINVDHFVTMDFDRINSYFTGQGQEKELHPAGTINPHDKKRKDEVKPDVNTLGEEYRLTWKSSVSPNESKECLLQIISEIRTNILRETTNSIGTIKVFTKEGNGSILSASDDRSLPEINQKIPWTSCPDKIVLNVLTYGTKVDISDLISTSFRKFKSKVENRQS